MFQSILLTGGTGKTGSRIAADLSKRGIQARIASRHPKSEQIRFDWSDASSFAAAVDGIESIYLIAPSGVSDCLGAMRPFLDFALAAGVQRFVFLSSSSVPEGGPLLGQVHQYLRLHAPTWVVLRPSWFMQNFSELQHRETIRQKGAIYSATGSGTIPFIDAADIAAVAAEALTDVSFPSSDPILTGPELLTYADVAAILSSVAGYPVRYYPLTEQQQAEQFEALGIPQPYAKILASLDTAIANGSEARLTGEVERITKRAPNSFQNFAESVRSAWERMAE
jgi:ergot alkaloid biosynthesis protein